MTLVTDIAAAGVLSQDDRLLMLASEQGEFWLLDAGEHLPSTGSATRTAADDAACPF